MAVTQEDVDGQWQDPPSSVSPFDYYIDVLHHSKNTYDADVTQAMYYGSRLMGDDYTIETSEDFIIANDVHTDEIVYDFSCSDNSIKFKQKNGLIYVSGVDASTDCWFEVITYIPKEKEEWWQDEPYQEKTIMTYNILGS